MSRQRNKFYRRKVATRKHSNAALRISITLTISLGRTALKKMTTSMLAMALASLSIGCATPRYADAPAPARFENTTQQKLQAANHWQVIADHFASKIAWDLNGTLGDRAIFIPQPGDEQPFVKGFRELLTTSLVQKGIPVSTTANRALIVDISYSIYRFSPNRAANTYAYGELSLLAAGLWAIGGIVTADVASAAGVDIGAKLLGTAAAVEGVSWLRNEKMNAGQYASGPVPRSEIILTSTIVDNSRIFSRITNIYYTSDDEPELYWDRPASEVVVEQGHSMKVSGDDCVGRKTCAR